ncbi:Thiol-disulfide oxidoreductase ResA [termite gut metagenome]|uniref:Thiol-disulfide oxidoreductase ResA n=1 Tax=termite gut metagenome TaxID=433724 RepID=A0A5J4RS54_9ZZZZ
MKKISFVITIGVLFAFISCNTENKSYSINGTVEGNVDEAITVYLQDRVNNEFEKLDSARVENGKFVLKGVQDSTVVRYISVVIGDQQANTAFFLENGNIRVKVTIGDKQNVSITGTPANNAYQLFIDKRDAIENEGSAIFESINDSTLSEEQIAAKRQEIDVLENKWLALIKREVEKNINSVVGIYLLNSYSYYYTDYSELAALLEKVPNQFQSNRVIATLSELAEKLKVTAVGQVFTDFEMETPDGKPAKLSDYVGKGKVVLVDFWASWCGPCRSEMPHLIATYEKYRSKGFEIVGVSLDANRESWKNGIEQLGITWPQISDLKYWNSEGSKLYGIRSIPHTVLIDRNGTIIARELQGVELQNSLDQLFEDNNR